jgi:hypothetical protein
MVRAELDVTASTLTLRLEGRFVGEYAENVRSLLTRCTIPSGLVIDMTDLTGLDSTGEEVLTWLGRIGGKFISGKCASFDICERLCLPPISRRLGSARSRISAHTRGKLKGSARV